MSTTFPEGVPAMCPKCGRGLFSYPTQGDRRTAKYHCGATLGNVEDGQHGPSRIALRKPTMGAGALAGTVAVLGAIGASLLSTYSGDLGNAISSTVTELRFISIIVLVLGTAILYTLWRILRELSEVRP